MKNRLDKVLHGMGLVFSRSQAENLIRLGKVKVNGVVETKAGRMVSDNDKVVLDAREQYVSRAGLKLASVAEKFGMDFREKTVLDVGSSTGGFTDYALQHGAKKVIAVDVGTDQLHPSLQGDPRIELHEQTDIRDVGPPIIDHRLSIIGDQASNGRNRKSIIDNLESFPDVIVVDVSFISLREVLPHISDLMAHTSLLAAMVKPQFEAGREQTNKGVIKNDRVRRDILKDFEVWSSKYFVIKDKADSEVAGTKGNRERFYLLKLKSKIKK
jgi:23S rRNA (cytidine1920-2'-O)/16S rRNA (cytidine1409-2'-O)-methyltransferase